MTRSTTLSRIFLIFFIWIANINNANSQKIAFSYDTVQEDYHFLVKAIKEAHFDPYAYISERDFNSYADSLRRTIPDDSLSVLETYNLYQKLISSLNTGHAELDFPIQDYFPYLQDGGTLFPLELSFENDDVFVRKNYSNNDSILIGSQILSIDGQPIEEILKKLYPLVSAERVYYKKVKIEFWSFPRMYWRIFPEKENYSIEYGSNGKVQKAQLQAIPGMQYENARPGEIIKQNREFKQIADIAYLNPGPFSSTEKSDEKQYKAFIDSSFQVIKNNNLDTLIIDLRNNSGGHNAFSDYMVSYFADEPFSWNSKFYLKSSALLKTQTRENNDTTDHYFKTILEKDNGEVYSYQQEKYNPVPDKKRYKGKVYVLINRHTYSMATVTAAMIQDYGWATLVGEETGDLPTLYASQFSFPLPNTGITIKLPKGYMVRVNGDESLQGTIPDIKIKDHLVDEKDEILSGLLEKF